MTQPLRRRTVLAALTGALASLAGCNSAGESASSATPSGPSQSSSTTTTRSKPRDPSLRRFATAPTGAETTGLFVSADGHVFLNLQSPSPENDRPQYRRDAVGTFVGIDATTLPTEWTALSPPASADERGRVRSAYGRYQVLANGGDAVGSVGTLGGVYAPDGRQLSDHFDADFNGFVPDPETAGAGYLFTNWETEPGAISRLHIRQRSRDADWDVLDAIMVDCHPVGGTWTNCFGSVSPWGTPLSAEEAWETAEPETWNDPAAEESDAVERLARYLGMESDADGIYRDAYPNPYRYGHILELTQPRAEMPVPVRRYALGRATHEVAVVMPDERTVYESVDGHGRGFLKFVADDPGDLSAGTLFAARLTQDPGSDPAEVGFDVEWIDLAHASDARVEAWASDYDDITQADFDGGTSYLTDDDVARWAAGDAPDDRVAFLETTRAADAVGATTEFTKMEGLARRPDAQPGDYLYASMSSVVAGMADDDGAIHLDENEYGVLYRMRLDDHYDVSRLEPTVVGGDGPRLQCPDNLAVLPDGRVLVAEDTTHRDNEFLWMYDPGTA